MIWPSQTNNRFYRSVLLTIALTTFVTVGLYLVRSEQAHLASWSLDGSRFGFGSHDAEECDCPSPAETTVNDPAAPLPSEEPVISVLPPKKGRPELLAKTPPYVKAILKPSDQTFQRLNCPFTPAISSRYAYLQAPPTSPPRPRYFFALDLHQIADRLPSLMGALIQVITFLGAHNCVLSIVEGRSTDGTYEILRSLAPALAHLRIPYFLQISDLSPQFFDPERIVVLAELRNLALRDLYENPGKYDRETTIIFANDVYTCAADVLEIIHQKVFQGAHMTCGMDWANSSDPEAPRLYDTWISRSMTGDTFYEGMFGWDKGIFPDHPPSRSRYDAFLPLQVFACWNGLTAMTAKPFMDGILRIRGAMGWDREKSEECYQGEPNLLAKDLWWLGLGRIAVIPGIITAYDYWDAHAATKARGPVWEHFVFDGGEGNATDGGMEEKIMWEPAPPERFHCGPGSRDWEWVPWDQNLQALYGNRKLFYTPEEVG